MNYKYFQKYIIDDLTEKGHIVDVFYDTYDTPKLNEYVSYLNPKLVNVKTYDPNVGDGNWKHILKIWADVLFVALDYEKQNNIKYDYFITSRFDTLVFEKISDLFLPNDAVSAYVNGCDNVTIIPQSIVHPFINTLIEMFENNDISHNYMNRLVKSGYKCNLLYDIKDHKNLKNWPLHRNIRHIFIDDRHPFKDCSIDDLLNPNSDFYVYTYKPLKDYNLVKL